MYFRCNLVITFILFLLISPAQAKPYGNYDPKRLLTVSETSSGKKYGIDTNYLDQMLNDLSLHAKNYPPQFDSPQDQQRAVRDAKVFSGALDILINEPPQHPELLLRAALLNSFAHNLNIPGAEAKTSAIFKRILAISPADPRANYLYGVFLAGAAKPAEAIPYLEKARALGVEDAAFSIGLAHLALGHSQQALKNLEIYRRHNPNDKNTAAIIEAIHSGNVKIKREK